jgi:hypothetical protein
MGNAVDANLQADAEQHHRRDVAAGQHLENLLQVTAIAILEQAGNRPPDAGAVAPGKGGEGLRAAAPLLGPLR